MKKSRYIFLVLTVIAAFQILYLLQLLLTPKYMDESRDGAMIAEYYDEAYGHDVIFVGDCEVYENFSPAKLWEEYGITSYVRGSPQQMIWQSYYLMEDTFRHETPKIMVFNVLSMKYDTPESTGDQSRREAYNRMALDGMRWSGSKWNSIRASMTEEEKQWQSMWTYLFPLLRYHDRWSQLTADDFRYLFHKPLVSDQGYLMQTGIAPVTAEHASMPLADYSFGETSWDYLNKMVELCREHGTELILIKAPSLYPAWWDPWDSQIAEFAEENDLVYINFLEHQEEIGLDWDTDTYDTGLHLNIYGAEKLTSYFGQYLSQRLPDHRGDPEYDSRWENILTAYETRKQQMGVAEDPRTLLPEGD